MQAGSPTNTGTSSDEIAQRFAGFFFRVLATEPEKVGVLFLRVLVRAMPRSRIQNRGHAPGFEADARPALPAMRCDTARACGHMVRACVDCARAC